MNKYLEKLASMSAETQKEIKDTSVIGAVGAGTGLLGAKILNRAPSIGRSNVKTMALMGGLGLAGDYAAVKFNKPSHG